MSIHVAIEHRTAYRYDRSVRLSPHVVRLRPAPHCRTPILAYSLAVEPGAHFLNWQQDPFGNYLARLVFPEPARELIVTVDLVADMTVINPFDFFVDDSAAHYPFRYDPSTATDLAPYLEADHASPLLDAWVGEVGGEGDTIIDFLVGLNRRLFGDVDYTLRMDPGVQTPQETLEKGIGSCRDSAWLLVHVLRRLGLAARFVSGYLVQLAPDEPARPGEGAPGPGADFTDLHAWAEVYVPGAGWIGLDATSGLLAGEGHIPLACTPRPSSAAAITGVVEAADTAFEFSNRVRRIHEDPRVTRPYTDDQWARIDALGRAVDRDLDERDTRLTIGGEPTFVSVDDMEAAEWNTAADGAAKRALAGRLVRRLADRWAPEGVIQHGQGKWYPGEPLPRWQIAVTWRTDGTPLWRRRDLLADPATTSDAQAGQAGPADAAALATAIAVALGVPEGVCIPAFEDPLYRLWSEARLPAGPPPGAPDVASPADPGARAAIVAALDADAGDPAGWVLPLHRRAGEDHWSATRWRMRRGGLYLVPGDSPIGLRLPLDSLTWTPPPPEPERSPFEPVGALPGPEAAPVMEAAEPVPPTALCVEVREGHLRIFLPPLAALEHAVDLLAAVERAASAVDRPVVLEGYPLPHDPRQRSIVVTPDPGVIEVNLQPVASWPELVEVLTTLFEDARATRLGTEKFALDGTHTGTGGGSHLTLGGRTPADSPLLRRPDLLRSMVTFWQHHPSLSYLFSGRFVGPTSQSPRVDEARHEALYELEIAFAELERLDRLGPRASPWQVDRLLRHLLVDLTGNTHRAEFCIDKLFSPDSERGRLGIVELRAFEMPPHPRMALVQALLVRALVGRFWREPYAGPLVRWGTELHDRFLLPWWVAADIADVVADLEAHGYPFEPAWLDPFLEFRFPRLGSVTVAGLTIGLRAAIEPWHVLGEEVSAGGTSRYVDSSVERLQVQVDGLTEPRFVVTCNRVPVPLQPTGTPGTFVAGVRYRAWQPPSALHPTIAVHAPLVFDVLDRWSNRSLGGCTYHVSHPGGLAYERFPVNANEAEARRASRFVAAGHTPGPVDVEALTVREPAATGEYPRTLDLRRAARR